MSEHPPIHGMLADFASAEGLLEAARQAHQAGYRRMDAYSPFHVEGLAEAVGMRATRLPWLVLWGGFGGALVGFLMQYFASAVDYPLNVGGRPLNSWPAFVPVTFELGILFAALAAVLGMLGLNRLPRPHHPLFGVERFARASMDRFFLCIEATDPQFDPPAVKRFLESAGGENVVEVPLP